MSQLLKNFDNYKILNSFQIGFEFEFYSKISFQNLLEKFNTVFNPIIVQGTHRYHSRVGTSLKKFKVEPDHSGGDDMVELVTHYFPYQDAKIILAKALTFLQEYATTTEKCSIQFNISYNPVRTDVTLDNLNILKFILNYNEEFPWSRFPNRKNSVYSKSIKRIIPYKGIDFANTDINVIANSLKLPDSKYFGVNFTKLKTQYLEFRYLGGADYQFKDKDINEILDDFIINVYNCTNKGFDHNDSIKLNSYLDDMIVRYKNFSKLEYFLNNFPHIELLVDKKNDYDILKTFYTKIWDKIFDFTINTKGLSACIINWDSDCNRLEIVNAKFEIVFELVDVDLINCQITTGIIQHCNIVESEINNCIIEKCAVLHSEIKNSKLSYTDCNKTTIISDCYFSSGIMNSTFVRGVYRKGRKGPNANFIDAKFVNVRNNFFINKDEYDTLDAEDIDGNIEMKK
jgi:hypothetical protein